MTDFVHAHSAARAGVQLGWYGPAAADDAMRAAWVHSAQLAGDAGFDVLSVDWTSASSPGRRLSDPEGVEAALALFDAVRAEWPAAKPMAVQLSVSERGDGPVAPNEAAALAGQLKAAGCDVVGVTVPEDVDAAARRGRIPPFSQMLLSDRVRNVVGMPTMMVGGILGADDANSLILSGRTDLCWGWPQLASPDWRTAHADDGGDVPVLGGAI